jgi:hypothetical protein
MINYPKIIFKYSWIYNQTWKEGWLTGKKAGKYPSSGKVLKYVGKIRKIWAKEERRILQEFSMVTGLKWKSKTIDCYVVGRCRPFSCPLTMPIYEKYPNYFIDVLAHELIHNLFIQNEDKFNKIWKYLNKKYKKESVATKQHIYLHAIHTHVYLKFYGEERLKRDIRMLSSLPDYKKSWDIVRKEGYEKIISNLRKII